MKVKKRTIYPETIKKVTEMLNEINDALKVSSKITTAQLEGIIKKRNRSLSTMTHAVKLGYFERIAWGQYKSHIDTFQPIHARRLIEMQNDITAKRYKLNKIAEKPLLPKETAKIVVTRKYVRRKKKVSLWSRLNPLNWF